MNVDVKTYRKSCVEISRLGLRCMRMSMLPDKERPESIATIYAVLEAAISLPNTGDCLWSRWA